ARATLSPYTTLFRSEVVESVQRQPGGAVLERVRVGPLTGLLPLREPAPVGDVDLVEGRDRRARADGAVRHELEEAGGLVDLDLGPDLLTALATEGFLLLLAVLLSAAGQLEHLVARRVHVPFHEDLAVTDD